MENVTSKYIEMDMMSEEQHWSRREFLHRVVGTGAAVSCSSGLVALFSAFGNPADAEASMGGGQRIGVLPFQAEPDLPFGVPVASGLDARVYFDLAKLEPGNLVSSNEDFYVRTGVPDQLSSTADWRLRLGASEDTSSTVKLTDLMPRAQDFGVHLLECAGNARPVKFGLISAATWTGIPIASVLERMPDSKRAKAVKISGFDGHSRGSTNSSAGCSWIFTADQLERSGAFLATHMNGQALRSAHGFPVRLVVPGWYGCCAIKWIDRLEWVADDVDATSQMREFAGRTHQDGVPDKAIDYLPAIVDPAAMPIRIEVWQVGEKRRYRVVGVVWGGSTGNSQLEIRFRPDAPYTQVTDQPQRDSARSWGLWSHPWDPVSGRYLIQLRFNDPSLQTRRLDMGLYLRGVEIPG